MDKPPMLTTIDNPYNPFTQFDDWMQFDQDKGYNSCELLARHTYTSNELSDSDNEAAIEDGIDEVVNSDPFGRYMKLTFELSKKLYPEHS